MGRCPAFVPDTFLFYCKKGSRNRLKQEFRDDLGRAAVISDMDGVSWHARKGVEWAVNSGLMTEAGDHHFEPSGHVTQEQKAAVLTRLCNLIFSTGTK